MGDAGVPRDQLKADTFSADELQQIREAIKGKYTEVSQSAEGKFKYITGKSGMMFLGYEKSYYQDISPDILTAFCGVGNPFSMGDIPPGNAVLDIGSGAGFDLIVAKKMTGPEGRVCGVDVTEEMIQRSQDNFKQLGLTNIEIQHIAEERLPYDDSSFDVVISNGAINLSPCKLKLFQDMLRVMKPGGRLQFADIVLDKELPSRLVGSLEAWSQ